MRAIILGAAAGGGLPQWNCAAPNSAASWPGGDLPAATQSSIAVTADGDKWLLVNASPDIRAQISAAPALRPRDAASGAPLRNTPIHAVLLTNGDVDHIAGLLTLREKQAFDLHATAAIHQVLAENPIFNVLDPAFVDRKTATLDTPFEPLPGLRVDLFAVPGKVPLFMEGDEAEVQTDMIGEQTIGCRFMGGGETLFYIPGCAHVPPDLAARVAGADALLFDGTVFHNDEMPQAGVGHKTGRRMGHMPINGPDGTLAAFADVPVKRKVFVHINNTNPIWRAASPERAVVEDAGWEVAYDGLEIAP